MCVELISDVRRVFKMMTKEKTPNLIRLLTHKFAFETNSKHRFYYIVTQESFWLIQELFKRNSDIFFR